MHDIILKNVSKQFATKKVLNGINLAIKSGEFILLQGQSGSGKTTLLNIIGGLEKADSGTILISEQDVSKLKGEQRTDFYRHQVGFIFQEFYLHPRLSVLDNISLAGVFANMPKRQRQVQAEKIARILDIDDVLSNKPDQISGGQAERACIARSIFMNPKIILADEPTNNLDDNNTERILRILQRLWQTTGATIIISSHDSRVEKYATRVVKLNNGVLV